MQEKRRCCGMHWRACNVTLRSPSLIYGAPIYEYFEDNWPCFNGTALFPGMGSTNERRRYIVTSSLIGWAHTQTDSFFTDSSLNLRGGSAPKDGMRRLTESWEPWPKPTVETFLSKAKKYFLNRSQIRRRYDVSIAVLFSQTWQQ